MYRYIVARVGQAAAVLLGAYTATFVGIQLLPGDPITNFLSSGESPLPEESIQVMKAYYGYDKPVVEQFFSQLGGVFQGNVGYSFVSGREVTDELGRAIGPTLELTAAAIVLAFLIALAIVTTTALTQHAKLREIVSNIPPFIAGIPSFWLGLVVLQFLSFRLRVMSIFPDGSVLSLLVPATILGLYLSAPLAQVMVKAVDNAQRQPFVTVLRAKGASESRIYFRHLLKYTAGSAITILGLLLGGLIAGTVVTETVFSRQGVGQVLAKAVTHQDLALVQGFVVLFAAVYVVINLIVDLLYPLFDPRIVIGTERAGERTV